MPQTLDALAQALLAAAKAAGADAADAIATRGTSLSIDVRNGTLEEAQRSEDVDIGLRVFRGQKVAIVSGSDISANSITTMAERAVAMADFAPENPFAGLADPDQLATSWDLGNLDLSDASAEPAPSALEEDARNAEAAAQSVAGVTQVQSASAGYSANDVALATSNGFAGSYRRTGRGLSCVAIAGQGTGMERDYDGDSRIHQSELRSPQDIGQQAGQRAVERLDARKPPTGGFPVLFDERISSTLIGHLLAAINGSAISRGASWLRDAMGTAVLPAGISLIEDPHRPRVAGSRPFDAEGLPTNRRVIVDSGELQSWSLDLATARQLGLQSTANAARGVGSGPSPTSWNVAMTQGVRSREDLIRDMGTGLLVTSMIGSTINPNTGDYSRGASGLWVENGEITHAVNECTIAGNLREMLQTLVPADDARTHLSRVVPSVLVEGMTLAGN